MAVSQIVYANAFYPGFFTAPIHLTVEIVFTDGENAAIRFHTIELFEIVLYLIAQKLGHLDDPVALGCFRCGDDILFVETLIRFV